MSRIRRRKSSAVLGIALILGLLGPAAFGAQEAHFGPAGQETGAALSLEALDGILKELQTYDFAAGVGALTRLRAAILDRKDDPQARKEAEAALIGFIQGSPAPGGLMAACRALSLIGGPASVPALTGLLLKPETSDPARYALERIPGPEAEQALLVSLDKARGDVRRGIVFSLGQRGSASSVPALERVAAGKDAILAADAVAALGRIDGPEAVRALSSLMAKAGRPLKAAAGSALLSAGQRLQKAGDAAGAAAIYEKMFATPPSEVLRRAAFQGRLETSPDRGKGLILKTLAGKDTSLFAPAIAAVPAAFPASEVEQVASFLPRLPEEARIQLTAALATYPADIGRTHLLAAAEDPSLDVRLAALRAIETAGDGKTVAFLASKAARTAGPEQDAARNALARLKGRDADEAVLAHLARTGDEAIKAELVQAASARRIAAAKKPLMDLVTLGPPDLARRAAFALRELAAPADIETMLGILGAVSDETVREALEDTIATVARTNPRELARANAVESRLAGEKEPRIKASLLRVLGKIGDDTGLALVRRALADPDETVVDAAVRALADWPTPTARDDVYEVARTSLNLTHRVLAIRAHVRMIGLEPYRSPEGAVADLLKVLSLATRAEEKKLVLGALVRFPCVAALKTAESLTNDPAVAAEASIAAARIRQALR